MKKYRSYFISASAFLLFILLAVLGSNTSAQVTIWVDDQPQPIILQTNSSKPAEFIRQAGISFGDHDRLLVNGIPTSIGKPLPNPAQFHLQVRHAHHIELFADGQNYVFLSSARTLGQALWENNIILHSTDFLSLPVQTPLNSDLKVTLQKSQPLRIIENGKEIELLSSAETVGQALTMAGFSLQNLDYSEPAENEPIPVDHVIKIVRVREEIQLQPTPIPFDSEYVANSEMALDTQEMVQPGEVGITMARVRVRYEDGRETNRVTEAEWISKEPVTQKFAYGTKYSVQTTSTPDGTIEYYRAVSVWITSYKDTGSRTASGKWPTKGDVAVNPNWYKYMKGSRLYIPGYGFGTVVDVCPGCVGKPWIDVFLPTAEYVSWHTTETIYFLTPVPTNLLWILE